MTSRRLPHSRPTPSLAGRDEAPRPPCADQPAPFEGAFNQERNARHHAARVAVTICEESGCPIREACLTAGINGRESGVWGGQLLDRGQVVPIKPHAEPPRRKHRAGWDARTEKRLTYLAGLVVAGGTIEDATATLGIQRGSLWDWLRRRDRLDLYAALSDRVVA